MPEYIEREAVLQEMTSKPLPKDPQHLYLAMRGMVRKAPTADVIAVRHGEWLGERGEYECSVCGNEAPDDNYWPSPYCPCCGAKMDLKEGVEE